MSQKSKTLIGIAVFILLLANVAVLYSILSDATPAPNAIRVEQSRGDVSAASGEESAPTKAPDFVMADWEGGEVSLSDFFGKPIVLNFWASWCPPCKSEMPDFDMVFKEMGGEVQFLMVNLTDGERETKQDGMDYVAQEGYSFPVYFDTDRAGASAYRVTSIPSTIFIDENGNIVTGVQGAMDEETLRQGIELIR